MPAYTPASVALQGLRNGHRVFVGSGCAQPQHLVNVLADRVADLYDVEIVHILTIGKAPYGDPKFVGHVRHNAFFIGPNVREAVERGDADYTPANLSDIPRIFRSGQVRVDYALIQVSPPDRHGFCSLGVAVDVVRAAVESARVIVAQVNPRMPRTHGDALLRARDIHHMVLCEEPILELPPPPADEISMQIGRYCASLVEDGCTLQAGIGAIPNAALSLLKNRRDLGVHTEMMSDWVVDLIEAGAITGRRKSINANKVVTSFAMGTRRLYDYIDDNPFFEFRSSDYVNDPFVIAQHARMISINSALQVDLTGQVCADSIGTKFYSGIGGQVDFVRGATRSPGGKSIIALPATAMGGKISRIVPVLDEGAGVVTARADVHYVITEFGIAELRGQSVRERALSLIGISHPAFREGLLDAARKRRILPLNQSAPRSTKAYPVELEGKLPLKHGGEVFVRPLKPTDEDVLRDLFYSHSEDTVIQRYGQSLKRLPPEMLHRLVNLDFDRELALGAFQGDPPGMQLVGVARYSVPVGETIAESWVTVKNSMQGEGLGTSLYRRLCEVARQRGVKGFYGHILATNVRMLHLLHSLGLPMRSEPESGGHRVTVLFDEADATTS